MRNKILITILTSAFIFSLTSCGNDGGNNTSVTKKDSGQTTPVNSNAQAAAIEPLLIAYLDMKDALSIDHSVNASEAGKKISRALDHMKVSSFSADQNKWYDEQKDKIESHALHILTNRSNINHQREHFASLSLVMIEMVKLFGSDKTLYVLECTEYNKNKGGLWLSDKKDDSSPYFGDSRKGCNTIKEEIKLRPA